MNININLRIDEPIAIHLHSHGNEVPPWAAELISKVDQLLNNTEIIMSLETEALDKLEASTAAINGAEDSAEAAFTRLADMIAALKTNTTDPATAARITAASDALRARADKLAAAVAATPT